MSFPLQDPSLIAEPREPQQAHGVSPGDPGSLAISVFMFACTRHETRWIDVLNQLGVRRPGLVMFPGA
ncbi:hypothetical protein AB1N83_007263 [Pleurotus pulmonarius]